MTNSRIHFSSASNEWETPQEVFHYLNKVFRFTRDVCASPGNAKCKNFWTKKDDALSRKWSGVCWMNPPYGREISAFMAKAVAESKRGVTTVCLVPARTDTRWWHKWARQGTIIYLRGRLKFGGSKNSAPFPSALVIFWGLSCMCDTETEAPE